MGVTNGKIITPSIEIVVMENILLISYQTWGLVFCNCSSSATSTLQCKPWVTQPVAQLCMDGWILATREVLDHVGPSTFASVQGSAQVFVCASSTFCIEKCGDRVILHLYTLCVYITSRNISLQYTIVQTKHSIVSRVQCRT